MQCTTTDDFYKITLGMNDSEESSLQLVCGLPRNVLQGEISTEAHKERMTLIRALFNFIVDFDEVSYNWRFVENHPRSESF